MQPSPRKGKLQESRQQLEELLSCQICYCRAVHPTLCPHCSKLYCGDCLATSLRVRAECPNCRRTLKGPVVQCGRFVGELAALVEGLVAGSEQGERCSEHGIALNYFCEDCRLSACCECKMFGRHQQHRFAPISQLYENKYQQIRDLLSHLRNRIVQQERSLTETENLLIGAKAKTEAHIAEIEEHTEKYRQKLAGECEAERGSEDVQELGRENGQLGEIKQALLMQLEHAQRVHCYRIDQELLDRLDSLLAKISHRTQHTRSVPPAEEAMPPLQLHRVVIANYTRLRAEKQPFFSDPVDYEGSQWRLIVYPAGNTPTNRSLSVFLELLSNPDALNLYLYHIELLHPHSHLSLVKNHHARFSPNECVGYAKFASAEDMREKHFVNEAEDTVSFAFGVRLCSYYDLYSRRKTLLARLDGQIQAKEDTIRDLEAKGKQSSSSIQLE